MVEQQSGPRHGCLGSELIAGYLDGRLTAKERESVELHLSTCDDCRELATETFAVNSALEEEDLAADGEEPVDSTSPSTATLQPEARASKPPRVGLWPPRGTMLWGSILGMAAAVLLMLWLSPAWLRDLRDGSGSTTQDLQALVTAVGKNRYVEPRLTGGFAWAPPPKVFRSANADAGAALPLDVRVAVARIEQRVLTQPIAWQTAQSLHVLGVAQMIGGHDDLAVYALDRAAEARPQDARVLSDIAAVHLVRATRGRGVAPEAMLKRPAPRSDGLQGDIRTALAAAERATAIDPTLPEAWFNLALAREAAGQRDRAQEAWRRAAALDQDPGWRTEATERANR